MKVEDCPGRSSHLSHLPGLPRSTVYLAIANSCPTDINGELKHEGSVFPQGITLYTSEDGGCSFNQACLPVAVKVRRQAWVALWAFVPTDLLH